MPSALFTVNEGRRPSNGQRRGSVLASMTVHAAVVVAVVALSLNTDIALPVPHERLAFAAPFRVVAADIVLPAPAHASPNAGRSSEPVTLPAAHVESRAGDAAPVAAPDGISQETGLEGAGRPDGRGDVNTVEGWPGLPGGVGDGGGIGVIAVPLPPPARPVRLHSGIRSPEKIVHVDPVYPSLAQSARLEGIVILEIVVSEEGTVELIRTLRSAAMLEAAAIDAVRRWRYKPAMLSGVPVPVIMAITVKFTLRP